MKAGDRMPEAMDVVDARREGVGQLLCYGTFELRFALDRVARYREVETRAAGAEIERDRPAVPIVSGADVR